jgi:glyoxylase-like metal-dependent hydrolase (beta-lactamase superfamily II)
MRVHHLSCGTMCPVGGRLFDGYSRGPLAKLVCHCLLIETEQGLVLVDTGLGTRDVERPTPRLSPLFLAINNIRLRAQDTAIAQILELGFDPEDVRHVVLTHLDFDHAGGLEDFPNATVHVTADEFVAAEARRSVLDQNRYRPRQWDAVAGWKLYEPAGEPWRGFDTVRELDGLPPEILLVSLIGHTRGHAGVAIDTGAGWLLHAGDAYFHHAEMGRRRRCPPGLELYQRLMQVDPDKRMENQERLRVLANDAQGGVRVFCAHDAVELNAMRSRSRSGPHGAENLCLRPGDEMPQPGA